MRKLLFFLMNVSLVACAEAPTNNSIVPLYLPKQIATFNESTGKFDLIGDAKPEDLYENLRIQLVQCRMENQKLLNEIRDIKAAEVKKEEPKK